MPVTGGRRRQAGFSEDAVANAKKARQLAATHCQTEIADKNGQLIELFKAGKAFHETETAGPNS